MTEPESTMKGELPFQSSPPAIVGSVDIESKKDHEDARLLLQAMKDTPNRAVSPDDAASKPTSTSPSYSWPTAKPLKLPLTENSADLEDLAACLVAMSRSSPTQSVQQDKMQAPEGENELMATACLKKRRRILEAAHGIDRTTPGKGHSPALPPSGAKGYGGHLNEDKPTYSKSPHNTRGSSKRQREKKEMKTKVNKKSEKSSEKQALLLLLPKPTPKSTNAPNKSHKNTTSRAVTPSKTLPMVNGSKNSGGSRYNAVRNRPGCKARDISLLMPSSVPPGPPVIAEPNRNDVVCGRGASIYRRPGNVQFREICGMRKLEYIAKQDHEKMPIAAEVVMQIRSMKPPGRFVSKHGNGMWYDVGDKLALKKTAMTLRQDARAIREADTTDNVKSPNAKGDDSKRALTWGARFAELVEFKVQKGHPNPQQSKASTEEEKKLARWLADQKKKYRNGTLVEDRSRLLRGIGCTGFNYSKIKEETQLAIQDVASSETANGIQEEESPDKKHRVVYRNWNERYEQLVQFKKGHGHANPRQSNGTPYADYRLAKWVTDQRNGFRKGILPEHKAQMLQTLGCAGFDDAKAGSTGAAESVISEAVTVSVIAEAVTAAGGSTKAKASAAKKSVTKKKATTSEAPAAKKKRKRTVETENQDPSGDHTGKASIPVDDLEKAASSDTGSKPRKIRNSRLGVGDYRILAGHRMQDFAA